MHAETEFVIRTRI